MKILAITCNVVMFLFTLFVIATDGLPKETEYIIFSIWFHLTWIISALVVYYSGSIGGLPGLRSKYLEETKRDHQPSGLTIFITIIMNTTSLVFFCYALVNQFPHPQEPGFIEYAALMLFTPIINIIVLFRIGMNINWLGIYLKKKV